METGMYKRESKCFISPIIILRIKQNLTICSATRRCDVLVQDKATGAITPWINQYDAGAKTIRFTKTAATRGMCDQGWGLSIFDRGMRVGDLEYVTLTKTQQQMILETDIATIVAMVESIFCVCTKTVEFLEL